MPGMQKKRLSKQIGHPLYNMDGFISSFDASTLDPQQLEDPTQSNSTTTQLQTPFQQRDTIHAQSQVTKVEDTYSYFPNQFWETTSYYDMSAGFHSSLTGVSKELFKA
jgi:hypothetical protein